MSGKLWLGSAILEQVETGQALCKIILYGTAFKDLCQGNGLVCVCVHVCVCTCMCEREKEKERGGEGGRRDGGGGEKNLQ